MITRFRVGAAVMLLAALASTASGGDEVGSSRNAPTTRPATPDVAGDRTERRCGLIELFGGAVRFGPLRRDGSRIDVRADFGFADAGDLVGFAVIRNDWQLRDGVLHGRGVGVSQIACLLPLVPDSCRVRGRLRSNRTFELYLLDPLAYRVTGTRAWARLHFGRMDDLASTDWMELSAGDRPLERRYDFRLVPGMQDASLDQADNKVEARLSVDGGVQVVRGRLPDRREPPWVGVALAGTVNNLLEIDRLEIEGAVDLDSDTVTCLTGLGAEFWGTGRRVTIHYRARGHFRRLLHNGQEVARQEAIPGIWWPTLGPLHRITLDLKRGDVLIFQLAGVDDEGALHVVGLDEATGRVVLASHPLTWTTTPEPPGDAWLRSPHPGNEYRPQLSLAQDLPTLEDIEAVLGGPFPGLPIIGPTVDKQHTVYLRMEVR
ncbi:MAG: hypothetical protein GY778_27075 [bacterium]|nr:hypothetical protein [bacterium]